jgi:DNA-binding transcriptional MerR regulator/uncharacterized RDD family membrane protein YckC
MRIQELEQLTGADRATIRYYEKEGLLVPERLENGYRNYTDGNARELMRILLLRKLGMSIYTISKLQKGSASFSEALEAQICQLTIHIEEQKRARVLCEVIRADGVDYDSLDARHYMKLLSELQSGSASRTTKEFREDLPRECHPWRRFFARWIDLALAYQIVHFLIVEVFWIRPVPGTFVNTVIAVLIGIVLVPVEAFLLSRWGSTPGKYVMGMRVESSDGDLLTWQRALQREWAVLRDGMCFQIPLISQWSELRCYSLLTGTSMRRFVRREDVPESEEMGWDEGSERIYQPLDGKRFAVLAVMLGLILACSVFLAGENVKPPCRGADLTVAQFADNYNHFAAILESSPNTYDRLNPDGTKRGVADAYSSMGEPLTVIAVGADSYGEEFLYDVNNGALRSVTLQRRWENAIVLTPMNSETAIIAYSMLLSQKGTDYRDIIEISRLMDENSGQLVGTISYSGIEISWKIEMENYLESNGTYYTDQDGDSSLEMTYTVRFV